MAVQSIVMRGNLLKLVDAKGGRIHKGGLVRIGRIPARSRRTKVQPVFLHIRGTRKPVRGFAQYGFAETFCKICTGPYVGCHSVEIEPDLLMVQRKRA